MVLGAGRSADLVNPDVPTCLVIWIQGGLFRGKGTGGAMSLRPRVPILYDGISNGNRRFGELHLSAFTSHGGCIDYEIAKWAMNFFHAFPFPLCMYVCMYNM